MPAASIAAAPSPSPAAGSEYLRPLSLATSARWPPSHGVIATTGVATDLPGALGPALGGPMLASAERS
jgi:hypothetical protein